MPYRKSLAVSLLLTCCLAAFGKDKKKPLLPDDVLQAETVLVVIDPQAGMAPEAPNANRTAQEDVEKALMKWGRFRLVIEPINADLIITVRKGYGKIVQPTIGGVPSDRPVIFEPTDSGGRAGGHTGSLPGGDGMGDGSARPERPSPQMEVGPSEDTFAVYRGRQDRPLDGPPVWRYIAKDALRSPSVPAVDEFQKLITAAEKQRAGKP